ncbi:hypothetical protein OG474_44150 [Kribbella sp. NBC_01505]|uniref:hypothetical protein n=1 Tax=Kribbella sp. NBC_01505 TaxID=2903580 RepID=UPI00386C2A31
MRIRRAVAGVVVVAGLVIGCSSRGSDTPQTAGTPSGAPTTPSPTPTPVDPTEVAKAQIMADYKVFIDTQSKGFVSNHPTFPYEEVMTGKALASTKSVMAASELAGTKYAASLRFLRGEVFSLNLKATPSTAMVYGCIFDGLTATSKKGKVTPAAGEVSTHDQVTMVDGRWKASDTDTLKKTEPGCA